MCRCVYTKTHLHLDYAFWKGIQNVPLKKKICEKLKLEKKKKEEKKEKQVRIRMIKLDSLNTDSRMLKPRYLYLLA